MVCSLGSVGLSQSEAQSGNRAVAAQALVRMAECYQKLGDSESRKIYEQIVRDYTDQKDAVTVAKAHLGAAPSDALAFGATMCCMLKGRKMSGVP